MKFKYNDMPVGVQKSRNQNNFTRDSWEKVESLNLFSELSFYFME